MLKASPYQAIVIGCSAGGVHALTVLLGGISEALAVPVIVVCHTGSEDIEMLVSVLSVRSRLPVREAIERQAAAAKTVHVAPGGYHLLLERGGCFALSVDARVCHSRPSIDVLFESAARHYQSALIGVVLTGANSDGAAGLRDIRRRNGLGIVQSPADAEVATMPQAAIEIAGADHVVPLAGIAALLNRLCAS